MILKSVFAGAFILLATTVHAQDSTPEKKWYDRLSIRGYAQLRYNRIGNPEPLLVNDQADKSIGDNRSLFLRRARIIFSGDVTDHLFVYIQPDFASSVSGGSDANHFGQLRDWYADIAIDEKKQFRFRAGQSKVPFGFENLQSSQNRLALDRADSLNSALLNERDLGLYFMWAPEHIRRRFKELVDSGLKGSGDYGVVAVGIFNGQTANRSEANDNRHLLARVSYPCEIPSGMLQGQIVEGGVQAYSGLFNTARATGVAGNSDLADKRIAASFMWYPKPIGLQAEWNWGRGPMLNAERTRVVDGPLRGGYVQTMYRIGPVIPFVRWHYYYGGKKHETNAPLNKVRELELGTEWQIIKSVELTAEYTFTDRTSSVSPYRNYADNLVRLQLQWSY